MRLASFGLSLIVGCAAILCGGAVATAAVSLPNVFGDHMVLQRDIPLTIWGKAAAGEKVTVALDTTTSSATADKAGRWTAKLPAVKADGKSHTLTVKGESSTVTLTDVAIGEVWLCSGQSNMEMGLQGCKDGAKEMAAADYPGIRLLQIPHTNAALPADDINAKWAPCTPAEMAKGPFGGFSAAAYYFGRELHKKLNVPVGLIDSSWGGTAIEPWTAPEGFAAVDKLHNFAVEAAKAREAYEKAPKDAKPDPGLSPTTLYNGMIHPLVPLAIRGALWYQGESNLMSGDSSNYTAKMQGLIAGWRKVFNQGDFPFYFVQLAPLNEGGYAMLPEFWEAQTAVLPAVTGTGMVLTTDITDDLSDIHPKDKLTVGLRLAALALHNTYGLKNVVCRGPQFAGVKFKGDKAVVTFDNAADGLKTRDGKSPDWFTIAGSDGKFVPAQAKITAKDQVTVWADGVAKPAAVRLGWDKVAMPNLCNSTGLPANGFRSDRPQPALSLAYHKPVTATTDGQGDKAPQDAVDGFVDNGSGWWSASSPASLTVDLQKPSPVGRIAVYPYYDGTRYYQYTVELSGDGKSWQQVVDMSVNTRPATKTGDEHKFSPVTARYVRVNMIKNSANPAVHLNEVLVFEAK